MKFGKWFGLVLLSVGFGLTAHAQLGVYVGYSATHFSGIQCLAPGTQLCSSQSSTDTSKTASVNPSGVMLGAYYDLKTYGPVRLGVDARYMHDRSNKSASDIGGGLDATGANTFLVGARGSIHVPLVWLKPYAEAAFGITSSDVTEPFCSTTANPACAPGIPNPANSPRKFDNFFRYEGFLGADLKLAPMLDLRLIELGIGNMNRSGSAGYANSTSSVGLQSIGAAVVFHLPK
ncbi:MAG: hypothetical protein V4555_06420 [Acidobacteriota bacterium]